MHMENSQAKRSMVNSSQSRSRSATAKEQIADISSRTRRKKADPDYEKKRIIIPRLARRAYHLEDGNTWWQDWRQYQRNTHPVLSVCMYHPWHPIRWQQRIVILLGSIAVGLAITNCVYLGFLSSDKAFGVNYIYDATGQISEAVSSSRYTVEQGLFFLLTVGSFVHSCFDMLIWYLLACACFREGGCTGRNSRMCQNCAVYIATLVVVGVIAAATLVVLVRLKNDEAADSSGVESIQVESKFNFLIGYGLELAVSLFVFYFITSTVFFSGILGCGRIPIFGGRPYELRKLNSNTPAGEEDEIEGMRFSDV